MLLFRRLTLRPMQRARCVYYWSHLSPRGFECYHSLATTANIINARAENKTAVSCGGNRSIGNHNLPQKSLASPPFKKLVESLKSKGQTCTIIESSCGGLISSSLMSVPGSSNVYYGGTVAYNTKKSGKLLCDEDLHRILMDVSSTSSSINKDNDDDIICIRQDLSSETKKYIKSKVVWTREAALSYCAHMGTDYSIAKGGATGPTFRPEGMKCGFAVTAVAGRKRKGGDVEILAQKVTYSSHADREVNMRLFADSSAELCLEAMSGAPSSSIVHAQSVQNESPDEGIVDLFFDRSSHIRGDANVMQDFYHRKDALHVLVRGTDELLFSTSTDLALPTLHDFLEDDAFSALFNIYDNKMMVDKRIFLGRLGVSQVPVFAMALPKDATLSYRQCYFANTRSRAPMLNITHNELALTATAYVQWQQTHRYCSVSGSPLEYIDGGTCAKSTFTDKPHFHWPRQDPSIIVLVNNPSRTHALLARSPRHPPYLYTALAGFVEAGETFESAVSREVDEEVGVLLDKKSIQYVASQPWPFPRSCMIGMNATSIGGLAPIRIDPNEIVDAQWFDKETVYKAARDTDELGAVMERQVVMEKQAKGEWSGELLVPPKGVLARTLVDNWLERD